MLLEEALEKVRTTGEDILVPCADKKQQASIRTMLFRLRKKILFDDDTIGISNYELTDDVRFVKIYRRDSLVMYHLVDGIPVPIIEEVELLKQPRFARQVDLMRKDGNTEEEIEVQLKEQEGD